MAKPGSSTDNPEYYHPRDFAMGTVVDIFKHKFVITGADEYAIKYMEERPDEYPHEVPDSFKSTTFSGST